MIEISQVHTVIKSDSAQIALIAILNGYLLSPPICSANLPPEGAIERLGLLERIFNALDT